jgi:hypothetical protein
MQQQTFLRLAAAGWLLGFGTSLALADDPKLSLPIQCEPGKTCFIQSYFDHDPGPGAQDHACGSATYDGHDGIDIRLSSAAETTKGVAVIAAADGIVKGSRDGMADRIAREAGGLDSVKSVECGNGVSLDHGDRFETQYCHMKRGSVIVKPGDKVSRGQKLGEVGFSGAADFPHVHLTVRKNGKELDPFTATSALQACNKDGASTQVLWDEKAAKAFAYVNGEAIQAGFTSDASVSDKVRSSDTTAPAVPDATSPVLLFFASFINLKIGDEVVLDVTGPGGFKSGQTVKPLDRDKAAYVAYAGKKRTLPVWPPGLYKGKAWVMRSGQPMAEISRAFELK